MCCVCRLSFRFRFHQTHFQHWDVLWCCVLDMRHLYIYMYTRYSWCIYIYMICYKKLNPETSLPACGRNRANKTYPSSTMRPITIVKHFLKGETPSVPLPPNIDDDATSNPSTGSWLLVSHSGTQANHAKNTKEVECQTTPLGPPLHHRPRFCAKRFFDLSKDDPTSVPSFSTRSKLPKLHYGGLQASQLDCFATASGSDPCLRAPQPVPYLKPTPKSLPSRASFRKAIATVQSTTEKDASEAQPARSQLRTIFYEIPFASKIFCEIHNSEFWTNTMIALLTVSAQVASQPTYNFGIIGHVGASVTCKCQLKHHSLSYSIIYMPQVTSSAEKIQNRSGHIWWHTSKLFAGWPLN